MFSGLSLLELLEPLNTAEQRQAASISKCTETHQILFHHSNVAWNILFIGSTDIDQQYHAAGEQVAVRLHAQSLSPALPVFPGGH